MIKYLTCNEKKKEKAKARQNPEVQKTIRHMKGGSCLSKKLEKRREAEGELN